MLLLKDSKRSCLCHLLLIKSISATIPYLGTLKEATYVEYSKKQLSLCKGCSNNGPLRLSLKSETSRTALLLLGNHIENYSLCFAGVCFCFGFTWSLYTWSLTTSYLIACPQLWRYISHCTQMIHDTSQPSQGLWIRYTMRQEHSFIKWSQLLGSLLLLPFKERVSW